jgi:Arc/MetJ family transcription regulator
MEYEIFTHEAAMRTNIDIDDKLMKQAMKAAGVKTKKAAVEEALRRMVQIQRQAGIRDLVGKVEFRDDVIEDRNAHSVSLPRPKSKKAT